jgi:GntR family galactonate operon transcriptional repressor
MIKKASNPAPLRSTPRQRNLHGQVVQEIGRRIVRGFFKPMDVLPDEETMGGQLGVSRTVVREAIKVLAAKGMVETRTRMGTRILPDRSWNRLDPEVLSWMDQAGHDGRFLEQLTEMRHIVEPAAARLAAERAAAADIDAITRAYETMRASLDDEQAYAEADTGFHAAILEASGNEFLKPITHVIRAALRTSLKVTNPTAHSARSLPLHLDILGAIRGRDPEGAAEAMRRHLDYTWRRIRKELRAGMGD